MHQLLFAPTALYDVYYGLVQSPFDYCSMILDNCSKTLHDKWQQLQNLQL